MAAACIGLRAGFKQLTSPFKSCVFYYVRGRGEARARVCHGDVAGVSELGVFSWIHFTPSHRAPVPLAPAAALVRAPKDQFSHSAPHSLCAAQRTDAVLRRVSVSGGLRTHLVGLSVQVAGGEGVGGPFQV